MALHPLQAGVDEAGRGPLAGPVVAAAVILDPAHPIVGLNDSKKLSHAKRCALMKQIQAHALAWAVGEASVEEIDALNILQATLLAMTRALNGLNRQPDEALIDGNKCPPDAPIPCRAIIQGDRLIPAISAASIIAKVTRDDMMLTLDQQYPAYGFAGHKGYGTRAHRDAILQYGPCPAHRTSFEPVKSILRHAQPQHATESMA